MDFHTFLTEQVAVLDQKLPDLITSLDSPKILEEAMVYSLNAGGKRVRPVLLLSVLKGAGFPLEYGYNTACALEMIHTYSLIHDDLPAMDNDDLRRGKPTNHKVFGEDMAILAGDGLLTESFSLITRDEHLTTDQRIKLITSISRAAGPEGMVAGQVADMQSEGKQLTPEGLEAIHHRKTGDLLSVSLYAGGIIAGFHNDALIQLSKIGKHIGLAFQIKDDLLDIEGTEEEIGKPVGSDIANNKNTYPLLLGVKGAKEKLDFHLNAAHENLETLQHFDGALLDGLISYIGERKG
ncbi:polyprenyl synthetase family protein [Salisediminibacterium beveridgei]